MTIDEYRGNKELIAEVNKASKQYMALNMINKALKQQNADLLTLLEEVKPTFYGMLLIEFGNPDEWPEDRQGIVVFRKLLQALGKEE